MVEIINLIKKLMVIIPVAAILAVILLRKYRRAMASIAEKSIIPNLKKLNLLNQFRYGSVIEYKKVVILFCDAPFELLLKLNQLKSILTKIIKLYAVKPRDITENIVDNIVTPLFIINILIFFQNDNVFIKKLNITV